MANYLSTSWDTATDAEKDEINGHVLEFEDPTIDVSALSEGQLDAVTDAQRSAWLHSFVVKAGNRAVKSRAKKNSNSILT